MTEERHNGTPSRRRAGETRQALSRGFNVTSRPSAPAVPDTDGVAAAAPAHEQGTAEKKSKPALSKYTALLDADTAAEFDALALTARRHLGRKVDKSEIVRSLIRLAADDASLRNQLIALLGAGEGQQG